MAGKILATILASLAVTAAVALEQPGGADVAITDARRNGTLALPQTSTFMIRGLGNRCWDFASGVARLAVCNGSTSQVVTLSEVNPSHDVQIHTSGGKCLEVASDRFKAGSGIAAQVCSVTVNQHFALDGDSVLTGAQTGQGNVNRSLAAVPEKLVTAVGTPLVLETRDVNDAEYFRFVATDGRDVFPHSGFRRVPDRRSSASDDMQLQDALNAGWGTVVVLGDERPLILTESHPLSAGTTIRGNRRGRYQGAQILVTLPNLSGALTIAQDQTRITGLRLQGPTASRARDAGDAAGIKVQTGTRFDLSNGRVHESVFLDHLEVSQWPVAAIAIDGSDETDIPVPSQQCIPAAEGERPTWARVQDNFLHHNEKDGLGYGVVAGHGAHPLIRGNMMYLNRHAVTSDGRRLTGYVATDNFILSDAPSYRTFDNVFEQDFDKHGTLDGDSHNDGIAGDFVDIGFNTFLGTNRRNFDERGTPCDRTLVHDNVFRQSFGDAITTRNKEPSRDVFTPNTFGAPDPTRDVAVGDFDGDGFDDVFVGTGAVWYYASGGSGPWTRLGRNIEHASELRFGDLDGDGRTDVIALHNGNVDVSWAGLSPWQTINVVAGTLEQLAVGDFDGNHAADLLLANGTQWFVAKGGRNWALWNTQLQKTPALRFGDFDHDGRTDVFAVNGNQWQLVSGGQGGWGTLRSALTTNAKGLIVADFDGDGWPDVARSTGAGWEYAARGWGGFITLRSTGDSLAGLPVGRFDDAPGADVLFWRDRHFWIASSGKDPTVKFSRQDLQ